MSSLGSVSIEESRGLTKFTPHLSSEHSGGGRLPAENARTDKDGKTSLRTFANPSAPPSSANVDPSGQRLRTCNSTPRKYESRSANEEMSVIAFNESTFKWGSRRSKSED